MQSIGSIGGSNGDQFLTARQVRARFGVSADVSLIIPRD
jgi:hypothetical protein